MTKTELAYLRCCQELTEAQADQQDLAARKAKLEYGLKHVTGKLERANILVKTSQAKFKRLRKANLMQKKFNSSAKIEPAKQSLNDAFEEEFEEEMVKAAKKAEKWE